MRSFFIVLISLCLSMAVSIAGSIKGSALDLEKTLESIEECRRVTEWRLLKEADSIKIECGEDNHKFLPKKTSRSPKPGPLRIGNFNLLHPGTDKTLFKDFDLVANLINDEFDVMAGIELVDVVADPEKKNKRLRPFIEDRIKKHQITKEQVRELEEKIKIFEDIIKDDSQSRKELETLNISLMEARRLEAKIDLELKSSEKNITLAESDVVYYSRPFLFLGYEVMRKQRMARLAAAQEEVIRFKVELEANKVAMQNSVKSVKDIESKIQKVIKTPAVSPEDEAKLAEMNGSLQKLKEDEMEAMIKVKGLVKHYRIAGYLQLLDSLRILDPNWALVISPHGDAALETNTQELVGYYFRADKVVLAKNIHCSNRFIKDSSACYPSFYQDFMGQDVTGLFSRRPFLATFSDGRNNFSLLAAHVVFESPQNEAIQKSMLLKAFGTEDIKTLGTGVTKQNYARFVEVSVTLDLIDRLRTEGLGKIIYTGDFNLEASNQFWKKLLAKYPGTQLLITEATSISESRFVRNVESNGVASNYDHFIISGEEARSCGDAGRINFLNNEFSKKIRSKYSIRKDAAAGPYLLIPEGNNVISDRSSELLPKITDQNFSVGNTGDIRLDNKVTEADMMNFKDRVFMSQLSDSTFYKFFVQVISDHLPIKLVCEF